jgi:xyloglucan fucosyltransferase
MYIYCRDWHNEVMASPSSFKSAKFLIFKTSLVTSPPLPFITKQLCLLSSSPSCQLGLGNQLETLVSSFVLAILTERIFLVDGATVHHLLQPPQGMRWHWELLFNELGERYIHSRSLMVNLQWQNPLEFSPLLCNDLSKYYKEQFVFLFSDQYYLPALHHNPHYAQFFRDWFPPIDIFGPLARFLVRPRAPVAAEIVRFHKQLVLSNSSSSSSSSRRRIIGIQLRTATMKGFDAEFCAWDSWAMADYPAAYFKCALLMDSLSQSSDNHHSSTIDSHSTAAMTSVGGIGAEEQDAGAAAFFLATDNEKVRPLAKAELGRRVHYFEQEVTRKINVGHATALIDMFLLALSDDIITTSMSTFGYVAAGLASLPPVLLSFQAQCARELTSQPCFHKWMYVKHGSCYNRTSMISPGLSTLLFLPFSFIKPLSL